MADEPLIVQRLRHAERQFIDRGMSEAAILCSDAARLLSQEAKPVAQPPCWRTLVEKAVKVLSDGLPPGGPSDREILGELYGIFDGPEYRACLSASPAGQWVSVPREPTEAMTHAGCNAIVEVAPPQCCDSKIVDHIYRAMLAASPEPRKP